MRRHWRQLPDSLLSLLMMKTGFNIIAAVLGSLSLLTATPGVAKFEDLYLLPPAPVTSAAEFLELDVACVDDPVVGPERGKIIIDNREALRARWMMIDNAKCEILIEYYTVASDRISIAGLAALIEAANRGVRIKILLDAVTHQIKDALAAATIYHPRARQNIEIRLFNPIGLLNPATWLARLHDKAIIVDGHEVILGGRNISNKYYGLAAGGFMDADLYLEGSFGGHARRYFYGLWDSDFVSPHRLTGYNYDTVEFCRQDDFRFDDGCQHVRSTKIPQILKYIEALNAATAKLELARSDLGKIATERNRLTRELQSRKNPSDEEVEHFIERDEYLVAQARAIKETIALDVTDTRAVITAEDLERNRAFVANGPVNLFYDAPGEEKSGEGVATALRSFLENRIRDGAVVTVISPYVVLGSRARELITYFIEERKVTFRFYTNSSVSSDNVFAQAFYRHALSKDFMIESGIEVFEFKGYRSKAEEAYFEATGQATTIHMKAALVENPGEPPLIFIGTFNVDLRSAHYNRELIAVIDVDASENQVKFFRDLTNLIEKHGYRAGLETHDAAGNMNEWYEEYLKTPAWKRILMKVLRGINVFTGDWLRRQA